MTLRKFVDAGVLLAIGFLVGMMVADISSAEQFTSEWQTLIAGILAVVAAAWTVNQMQISDIRQEERHKELLNVNEQPDRRRVAKAVQNATSFREAASVMKGFIGVDGEGAFIDRVLSKPSEEEKKTFLEIIVFCELIADAKNIPAATDLFGPRMNTCWVRLVGYASHVKTQRNLLSDQNKNAANARRTHLFVGHLADHVTEMAGHLDDLATKYNLDNGSPPNA